MTTTAQTGPVEYGESYKCGCGADLELERLDQSELIQVWECPEGHAYVRDFSEREDGRPVWRRVEG